MAYEDRIQRIAAQRKRAEATKAPDRRFGQYETRMRDIARSGKGLPGDRRPLTGQGLFSLAGDKFPKTLAMRGADMAASMFDALGAGEKARVGGFNTPLNVKKGSNAYQWLLDEDLDIIKDEYKDDFKREVGKDDLYWSELNKYADDKYIGGGQLAKGINARNEGLFSSDAGRDILDQIDQAQIGERGDNMIGDALKNYGGRGTFLDPREITRMDPTEKVLPDGSVINVSNILTQEEQEFYDRAEAEQRERRIGAIDDFVPTPPRRNLSYTNVNPFRTPFNYPMVNAPDDPELTGDAQIAEDIFGEDYERQYNDWWPSYNMPPYKRLTPHPEKDLFPYDPTNLEEEEYYPFKYLR